MGLQQIGNMSHSGERKGQRDMKNEKKNNTVITDV